MARQMQQFRVVVQDMQEMAKNHHRAVKTTPSFKKQYPTSLTSNRENGNSVAEFNCQGRRKGDNLSQLGAKCIANRKVKIDCLNNTIPEAQVCYPRHLSMQDKAKLFHHPRFTLPPAPPSPPSVPQPSSSTAMIPEQEPPRAKLLKTSPKTVQFQKLDKTLRTSGEAREEILKYLSGKYRGWVAEMNDQELVELYGQLVKGRVFQEERQLKWKEIQKEEQMVERIKKGLQQWPMQSEKKQTGKSIKEKKPRAPKPKKSPEVIVIDSDSPNEMQIQQPMDETLSISLSNASMEVQCSNRNIKLEYKLLDGYDNHNEMYSIESECRQNWRINGREKKNEGKKSGKGSDKHRLISSLFYN